MTYTPNLWGHSLRGVFPCCLAYLLEEGHPVLLFFLLLPIPLTCEGPVSRA